MSVTILPSVPPADHFVSDLRGNCEKCPLSVEDYVPGQGKRQTIAIVGEAPGVEELRKRRPFVGKSGALIRETLEKLGFVPRDGFWTNAAPCRPPGNDLPGLAPVLACRDRLLSELAEVQPDKILILGAVGLTSLLGGTKRRAITKERGRGIWITVGDRQVYAVPTYHPAYVMRDPAVFPDFAIDVGKLLMNDRPADPPDFAWDLLTTEPEVEDALLALDGASIISCDLETTGLNPMRDRIISIGFGAIETSGKGYAAVIPWELVDNPKVRASLRATFGGPVAYRGTVIFHNAKFDLQFLARYLGEFPEVRVGDTMLDHYGIDERSAGGGHGEDGGRSYRVHGLKELVRSRYDQVYGFDFKGIVGRDPSDLPAETLAALYEYHAQDCYYTVRLREDLRREVEEEGVADLVDNVLVPGAIALAKLELHGALIDRPYLEKVGDDLTTRIREGREALDLLASQLGYSSSDEINWQSGQQIARVLYDVAKCPPAWMIVKDAPVRSTDKAVLAELKRGKLTLQQLELVNRIQTDRQDTKILGTYIGHRQEDGSWKGGMLGKLDPDGRIRSDFLIHGARTGRLSSQGPNLQNIPARMGPVIRDAFVAPTGSVLVEADYSQLELRVAAWLSRDERMMATFHDPKRDIHREVAASIFGKALGDVTKQERDLAKRVDFGAVFGLTGEGLVNGATMAELEELGFGGMAVDDADFFIAQFLDGFPGFRAWTEKQARIAIRDRRVTTPMGRARLFQYIPKGDRGWLVRRAVNTPIQSVASDLCLTALTRLADRLPDGAHAVLTVHDSILFEIRRDTIDRAIPIIITEMQDNLPVPIDVPIKVEVKIGDRWGSLVSLEEWRAA